MLFILLFCPIPSRRLLLSTFTSAFAIGLAACDAAPREPIAPMNEGTEARSLLQPGDSSAPMVGPTASVHPPPVVGDRLVPSTTPSPLAGLPPELRRLLSASETISDNADATSLFKVVRHVMPLGRCPSPVPAQHAAADDLRPFRR